MTSVYFPSHVLILFKRLVNVVSTLSISKHCISYTAHSHPDHNDVHHDAQAGSISNSLRDSTQCLKALAAPETDDWPSLMIRQSSLFGTICEVWGMRNAFLRDPSRGEVYLLSCFFRTQGFVVLCRYLRS